MEKGENAYQDVVLAEGRNRDLSDLVHLGLIVPERAQSACPRTRESARGVQLTEEPSWSGERWQPWWMVCYELS
jgi:hypothetical protein